MTLKSPCGRLSQGLLFFRFYWLPFLFPPFLVWFPDFLVLFDFCFLLDFLLPDFLLSGFFFPVLFSLLSESFLSVSFFLLPASFWELELDELFVLSFDIFPSIPPQAVTERASAHAAARMSPLFNIPFFRFAVFCVCILSTSLSVYFQKAFRPSDISQHTGHVLTYSKRGLNIS